MSLPRYPELKERIEKLLLEQFEEMAREETGVFRDVRRFVQHEGRALMHNTLDDTKSYRNMKFEAVTVELPLVRDEIADVSIADVMSRLSDMAKGFGEQQARYSFQAISDATEAVGNVVDMAGQPLTVDIFLDIINKLSIAFDPHGNPRMPTVVIHPSMAEKYRELIEQANGDEGYRRRFEVSAHRRRELRSVAL